MQQTITGLARRRARAYMCDDNVLSGSRMIYMPDMRRMMRIYLGISESACRAGRLLAHRSGRMSDLQEHINAKRMLLSEFHWNLMRLGFAATKQ